MSELEAKEAVRIAQAGYEACRERYRLAGALRARALYKHRGHLTRKKAAQITGLSIGRVGQLIKLGEVGEQGCER